VDVFQLIVFPLLEYVVEDFPVDVIPAKESGRKEEQNENDRHRDAVPELVEKAHGLHPFTQLSP
jgi:hypothetical protein